jgi:hypothetical protein
VSTTKIYTFSVQVSANLPFDHTGQWYSEIELTL